MTIGRRVVRRAGRGDSSAMTDPERTPELEQRMAQELDPERHRKPSEGVPQDLPDDDGEDELST